GVSHRAVDSIDRLPTRSARHPGAGVVRSRRGDGSSAGMGPASLAGAGAERSGNVREEAQPSAGSGRGRRRNDIPGLPQEDEATGCAMKAPALVIVALATTALASLSAQPSTQSQSATRSGQGPSTRSPSTIRVTKVRPNIYMLTGAGS